MGYEIILSAFAYQTKTLAKGDILILENRKVRWCPKGCDQVDLYDLTTYSATPGYFVLRMVIVLAIENPKIRRKSLRQILRQIEKRGGV